MNLVDRMQTAIDQANKVGAIAEVAICYTGDCASESESKYTTAYYVRLAGELKSRGADLLAIKDMAGLLKPAAARELVRAIKESTGLVVALHSHDTAGIQSSTYLAAAQAGVDIVDCAISSMSGFEPLSRLLRV